MTYKIFHDRGQNPCGDLLIPAGENISPGGFFTIPVGIFSPMQKISPRGFSKIPKLIFLFKYDKI